MINSNKILTVSYGTFSCTLEGFDDSFGTMKAIAEYFRDLSADDRYFGAEPVQPDAQMLARIAQREISRQVDAREDEGRIVLSARELSQQSPPAVDTTAPEAPVAPEASVEQAAAPVQDIPDTAAQDDTPSAKTAPEGESIADAAPTEAADEIVEDMTGQTAAEAEAPAAALSDDPEHDIVPSLPDAEVEAFFADSSASDAPEEDIVEEIETDQEPAQTRAKADSIAEKLKRIRAVVSHQPEAVATLDYSEDQHADADNTDTMADIADVQSEDNSDMLSTTLRDIEDALEEDDAFEPVTAEDAPDAAEEEDDDIAAILSRLEDEADDEVDANLDNLMVDEDDAPEADDDLSGNILSAMDEDGDREDDDNMFDAAPETPAQAETEAEAPAPAKPAAPRARVLKVKRATLEAAIKSGQLEEYDDEDEAEAAAPADAPKSSLSDEAEAELARELAELEADMAASKAAAAEEAAELEIAETADADLPDEQDTPAEPSRAKLDAGADESFSRLMEETENQMVEPEGSTRRDAFAHLRAAVAAKKADEAVGGTLDERDNDEAYREDLASVVRPRRPTGSDRPRTERPSEPRPAPLKLVAEQRIDTAEPRHVTPVRPRRVVAAVPTAAEQDSPDASSFADFAAEMGALQLPDLLEAAAAYLSFVEGHEEFSRPQLMTKVRQVEKENFTREDGLRCFGKLLREGKIEKLAGGRFQASDQISFKPDARAAG
ncbi:MAG: hypothetical protein ABJP06_16835 [Sulfitobacter sp.]